MRVLVVGATGMLGSTMLRYLANEAVDVTGTLRGDPGDYPMLAAYRDRLIGNLAVEDSAAFAGLLEHLRPEVTINCIFERERPAGHAAMARFIDVNAEWPHRLAALVGGVNGRLIHFSTDGVFAGTRGAYGEGDVPDATDLYGLCKRLGEISGEGCLTLRTSMIGRDIVHRRGLVEWLLGQAGPVSGYADAVFSGLPAVELAAVTRQHLLSRGDLSGTYHLSAAPISKLDLLRLIARRYGKTIEIEPVQGKATDLSLDSSRFAAATGYVAPDWDDLIDRMHCFG